MWKTQFSPIFLSLKHFSTFPQSWYVERSYWKLEKNQIGFVIDNGFPYPCWKLLSTSLYACPTMLIGLGRWKFQWVIHRVFHSRRLPLYGLWKTYWKLDGNSANSWKIAVFRQKVFHGFNILKCGKFKKTFFLLFEKTGKLELLNCSQALFFFAWRIKNVILKIIME